ncbi:YheT family hydrolase [Agarilytica rhodophyticola]|uniref:YheT family hydrolase n=1 Tax=Agarilytica rhodophyticola TaxID=1737490 RepID=UPI000B34991C|nr:alpha/beta fold hydrolase [Agarilytica rhodophyticola]
MSRDIFKPSVWIANTHVQNLITSSRLRRILLKREYSSLIKNSQQVTLEIANDVRLSGMKTIHNDKTTRPLLILFHGWEGSCDSGYVLSSGGKAFESGFNIFRLNFKDHHDSHHLNEGIFNSSLIDEAMDAIAKIQTLIPHTHCYLAGFSLGANFALRVGTRATELPHALARIVSICPVIRPDHSTQAITDTLPFYEWYFVRKWKHSLQKKLNLFPQYNYQTQLESLNTLVKMNDFFIPEYTGFDSVEDYFQSYTITPELLSEIKVETLLIASKDDPVIPIEDIEAIQKKNCSEKLTFDIQDYGSHCAFIKHIRRASWADERMLDFITAYGA